MITTRGGSQVVPRKNVQPLVGKPLLAWNIRASQAVKYFDRTILSPDGFKIMHIARQFGCDVPFRRPDELALPTIPGIDPCCTPSNTSRDLTLSCAVAAHIAADVDDCIEQCVRSGTPDAFSIVQLEKVRHGCFVSATAET